MQYVDQNPPRLSTGPSQGISTSINYNNPSNIRSPVITQNIQTQGYSPNIQAAPVGGYQFMNNVAGQPQMQLQGVQGGTQY